jgi:hypothetical protein
MDINIDNYEVFIIDYLDGKLNPLDTAQLLVFLENHPGLKDEFEDLRMITISPDEKEVFGFNEALKQPSDNDAVNLSMLNYQHYFIADIEGDLTPTGHHLLNNFLNEHPELHSEYQLFKATKLIPDKKIKFPQPDILKTIAKSQTGGKRLFMRYYFAAGIAASLLLLFTIWLKLTPGTESDLDKNLSNSIARQAETQFSDEENKASSSSQNNAGKTEAELQNSSTKPANPKQEKINSQQNPGKPVQTSPKQEHKAVKATQGTKTQEGKGLNMSPGKIIKIEQKGVIINNTPLYSENRTRNFYSDLYDDIKLSQELTMIEKEENDQNDYTAQTGSHEKKAAVTAGRLLNSIITSGEQIAQQIPGSLNGWLFADLSVKGFNLLTNNSYVIDRKINDKGKVEYLKLKKEEESL